MQKVIFYIEKQFIFILFLIYFYYKNRLFFILKDNLLLVNRLPFAFRKVIFY